MSTPEFLGWSGGSLTALQLPPGVLEGIGAGVWLFVQHNPLNVVLTAQQGMRSHPLGNLLCIRNGPLGYIQHSTTWAHSACSKGDCGGWFPGGGIRKADVF